MAPPLPSLLLLPRPPFVVAHGAGASSVFVVGVEAKARTVAARMHRLRPSSDCCLFQECICDMIFYAST